MHRKTVCVMLLALLVFGILMTTFNIQLVEASGTVHIGADGSISPSTAPIQRLGDIYTFTADISDSIVVEKDDIVIDGASHTLQGSGGVSKGFWLWERTGITIKNLEIRGFQDGIAAKCSSCQFAGNVIAGNDVGINLQGTGNSISGNTIDESQYDGIMVQPESSGNNIAGNTITGSGQIGIDVLGSTSGNTISANTVSANGRAGIILWNTRYNTVAYNEIKNNAAGIEIGMNAEGNTIFHNRFTDNTGQVLISPNPPLANTWDDDYPSGGNYWSDYAGVDADGDGIGDTPYVIDANNVDHYPWIIIRSLAPELINLCIIPVDTADQGIAHSEAYFAEIGEKFRRYYSEVSYGHVDVTVEICHQAAGNWVALTQTTAWYQAHTAATFLQDAVDAADGLIDFTIYDYASQNGKGIVAVVPPTDIFGGGAFIMYDDSATSGAFTTDDNTGVDAIYVPEGRFRQADQIVRGLAHEFGHALGKLLVTSVTGNSKDAEWVLPDLYLRGNVDMYWCLMGKLKDYDIERVHLSSYCKEWLGWLKYKDTYIGETHTLKSLVRTGFAGDVLRYSFEQGAHFYIMELRSNSTAISQWDNETTYQKAVSFYEVDVKTDPAEDTINLAKNLTETGSFSDPDAGVTFNVQSMTEENAQIAIRKYHAPYVIGYVLQPFAIPWAKSLPYIPHEVMEQIPLPDTDLHAYTEDGKHVGMNYETGQYESEIPGALASGDLFNGREWIFVPEDVKARFVVDSHDTQQFLEAFPEAGDFTDGVETYSGKLVYYDPNEIRSESTLLTAQIEPGRIIQHSCAIIENPDHTYTPVIDDNPPLLTVETPLENVALQDGQTLRACAWDENGVSSVTFSIREPNGEHGIPISPDYEYMPASPSTNDRWTLPFDTTQLSDGYYLAYVEATDIAGNKASETVPFSIRNWAPIELLPASKTNKAGRTMPVKFSIRVIASVDPTQPFIRNEELTIKIYRKGYPGTILQTSTHGTTSTDYRIDPVSEKYITNFKTLSTPATYAVEIYRKGMLIGSLEFETIK